jgi:hypothetical protein
MCVFLLLFVSVNFSNEFIIKKDDFYNNNYIYINIINYYQKIIIK